MKKFIINFILAILTIPGIRAQNNILKANLSSVALGNVYLSYERIITKKISFQLGLNWVPSRKIPFSENFSPLNGNVSPISQMKMNGWGITPELRLYTSVGKGPAKGFYLSPYFRYTSYTFSTNSFEYNYFDIYDENKPKQSKVDFSGKASFIGGGILIGHQWIIGKHFSIDFWILGLGISSGKFDLNATSNNMDARYFEKGNSFSDEITDNLKALNTVQITNGMNFVHASSSRILPGLRGLGLNVGFAF